MVCGVGERQRSPGTHKTDKSTYCRLHIILHKATEIQLTTQKNYLSKHSRCILMAVSCIHTYTNVLKGNLSFFQVSDFTWSHDGTQALIAYRDGFVLVGSVSGQRHWSSEINLESQITCGIWTPDDQQVTTVLLDLHECLFILFSFLFVS